MTRKGCKPKQIMYRFYPISLGLENACYVGCGVDLSDTKKSPIHIEHMAIYIAGLLGTEK
jgi:hypothetical protein